jgi:hypothetical protein
MLSNNGEVILKEKMVYVLNISIENFKITFYNNDLRLTNENEVGYYLKIKLSNKEIEKMNKFDKNLFKKKFIETLRKIQPFLNLTKETEDENKSILKTVFNETISKLENYNEIINIKLFEMDIEKFPYVRKYNGEIDYYKNGKLYSDTFLDNDLESIKKRMNNFLKQFPNNSIII